MNMNKWQKIYCETYYEGKMPRTKYGKWAMDILSQMGDKVIIHFPNRTETYTITEYECDMPNGKISVRVLVANLELWISRGYKIETI